MVDAGFGRLLTANCELTYIFYLANYYCPRRKKH